MDEKQNENVQGKATLGAGSGIESRLGDSINEEPKAKNASVWDFLTAAYSANKAVKVGLAMGAYSIPVGIVSGLGVYLAVRTIGGIAKIAGKTVTGKYRKMYEIGNDISSIYRPLGKYSRPTVMGSSLSGITYATGF